MCPPVEELTPLLSWDAVHLLRPLRHAAELALQSRNSRLPTVRPAPSPPCPQDMTTRLWDLRYPAASFALLKAHIGAVRSLRFRCAPPPLPAHAGPSVLA